MNTSDLLAVEDRVKASKADFLNALEECKNADGKQIIETFLREFLSPEREGSEMARQHAKETIALIDRFTSQRISLTADIGIANLKMQQAIGALTIGVLTKAVYGFEGKSQTTGSAIDDLKQQINSLANARDALAQSSTDAITDAVAIGQHIERVQRTAASLLRMRTLTLRAFKKENLGVSFAELIKRMREELEEDTKAELFEESWEAIRKLLAELFEIVLDEEPFTRVMKVLQKLGRILGPREIDTSPGGTDQMQRLLEQLRKETNAFEALGKTYGDAMLALDKVIAAK